MLCGRKALSKTSTEPRHLLAEQELRAEHRLRQGYTRGFGYTFRVVWPAVMITVGYATLHHRYVHVEACCCLLPSVRLCMYQSWVPDVHEYCF
jgi:hypothetical protein